MFDKHPTSILRDDALFQEALLARKDGDRAAACDATRLLVKVTGESRFATCARELCPDVAPPEKAPACRGYVKDLIEGKKDPEPSGSGS